MELLHEESFTNINDQKFNIRVLADAKEITAAINEYSDVNNPSPVATWTTLNFPRTVSISEVLIEAKKTSDTIDIFKS